MGVIKQNTEYRWKNFKQGSSGKADMKWEEVENGDRYTRLNLEADWAELAADYDDILAGYEEIPVPGFRSGKVPQTVTEKRFHREI